jgi:hypothetical protein
MIELFVNSYICKEKRERERDREITFILIQSLYFLSLSLFYLNLSQSIPTLTPKKTSNNPSQIHIKNV